MGQYLDGRASLAPGSDLRRHLESCPDCNDRSRQALVLGARIGREARRERERERLVEQPQTPSVSSRFGMDTARATRLRRMLIPAVFILLMANFEPQARSSELELLPVAGDTRYGETLLVGGGEAHMLLRGDWCETGPGGRAQIRTADFVLELGPGTSLLVERAASRRFRLARGRIDVRGACEVTSPLGVVEVQSGHASLVITVAGLEIENESAQVSAANAWGRRELAVGETFTLASSEH